MEPKRILPLLAVSAMAMHRTKLLTPPRNRFAFFSMVFLMFFNGMAWGQTTITIDIASTGITSNSYDNGAERTWTQGGVDFGAKAVLKASGTNAETIQFQASNGVIYNTTAIPGIIKTIKVTKTDSNGFTLYGGNSGRMVNSTAADYTVTGTSEGTFTDTSWTSADLTSKNYTYFALKKGSNASYVSSIEITYVTSAPSAPNLSNESYTGTVGAAFSETPSNTGGTATSWAVVSGSLPAGLSLNASTGEISGTPTVAGNNTVDIKATNATGDDTATYDFTINTATGGACFSENFASITSGDNTTTGGSSTAWTGNTNFPTVNTAYQAGGTVRLGSGSASGLIESMALIGVSGNITVNIKVKGWTTVEGQLKVSIDGQTQTLSYTAKIADSFETVTANFTGVTVGSKLKIETTAKRAFIDIVEIICEPAIPDITPPTLSTFNPVNNATGVGLSSNLVATFSENVVKGTGNILIRKNSDNTIFQTIAVSDAAVSISGATVTINPNDFDYSNTYFVEIPNGAFEDAAGNKFAGFSGNGTWLFTTLSQAPPVINSSLTKSTVYGTADTYTISATNPPNTYSTDALPTGFSFSGATISKAANVGAGTYNIDISATNSGGNDTKTLVWTVTPKNLTITGLNGNTKEYDGNTTATLGGTATLNGVVGTDDVNLNLSAMTATFNNKNVGTNKPITVTGYTLSGAQAGNYTLTQPTGITGNITPKALTVSGATAQNKVYDGTTAATITGAALVGVILLDVVTVSGGGTFASPNVGTNIAVTANLSLVGEDKENYSLTQPTGLSANITKANPVFTTSTISLNIGGTYTLPGANISSTSNGVFSYSITGGGHATYDGAVTLTGVSSGDETLTVNQASTANYNAGNTTVEVEVSLVTYVSGDFRSTQATGLSYNYGWEYYNGSSWVTPPGGKGPQNSSSSISNIYINHYVDGGGSSSKIYNCNFIINSGGSLYLMDNAANPDDFFINANKKLEVKSGGELYISGDISISTTGNLIVRNGGQFTIDGDVRIGDKLWNGVELFEGGSTVTINEWGWNGAGTGSLINTYGQISDNANGFKFGNLIVDADLTNNWTLVGGSAIVNLTENNLELYNIATNSSYFISGTSNNNSGFTVNGDMIIYDGAFNFGTTYTGNTSFTNNYTVNGDFINISDDNFKLHHIAGGTSTPAGTITIKGDIEIGADVIISNDGNKKIILETGTEAVPKFIDIAANVVKTNIDINTGYRRLKQDLVLGTSTKVTVKNTAILDFGFDNNNIGTTALLVRRFNNDNTQNGQAFELQNGGTLKITSPDGISEGGAYTGNVQVGTSANRTFGTEGVYHYIGKANQITGKGLPLAPANKHVIVELAEDNLEFTSSNGIVRFNNPNSASGANFKGLEIRKGIVISDNAGNRFEDSTVTAEKGNLKMSGGIFRILANGMQPSLSGVYELELPSKIDFNLSHATDTQSIRAVNDDYKYANIDVSGTSVTHASGNIVMKANTVFDIKPNAVYTSSGTVGQIISLDENNKATLLVENNGLFRTEKEKGFYGPVDGINPSPSVRNNVDVTLEPGSTVDYFSNSPQLVSVFSPGYQKLKISGTGPVIEKADDGNGVEILVNQITEVTAAGKLVVKETDDDKISNVLSALGGISIQSGGDLSFENNAQLKQNDDAVNSGIAKSERKFIFSTERKQYNFVISPMSGQNLIAAFSPASPNAQAYNEKTNFFDNVAGAYVPGRALAIKEPPTGGVDKAIFSGGIVNGNIDFTLQKESYGYNLVGNPYQSNLDLVALYNDNSGIIESTFYLWDNRGNTLYEQQGEDYNGDHYAKFNADNGTGVEGTKATGVPGSFEERIPNGIVKVANGFMMQSKFDNQPFTFKNDYRSTDSGPGFFGKNQFLEKDRYWLTLTTPDGIQTMNAMVYFENGNDGFSADDTESSDASDEIYTILDQKHLAIQGKRPFRPEDEIPLGYSAFERGTHIISVYKTEGVFESGIDIYLIDHLLNVIWNLSEKPYKFVSRSGQNNSRFTIVYKPRFVNASDKYAVGNQIEFVKKDNQILVKSSNENLSEIEIFDLHSRSVFKKSDIDSKEFKIDSKAFNNQLIVISVTTENGEKTSKKFIN